MSVKQAIARIRKFKKRNQLTGVAFARAAGLHDNTLRDIDSPDWNPRAETLIKLESAMGQLAHQGRAA